MSSLPIARKFLISLLCFICTYAGLERGSGAVVFAVSSGSISSFAPARNYITLGFPYAVTTGDFNNDGRPDIAVANIGSSGGVSVLLNDGTGGFGMATTYPTGFNTYDIVTRDFNNNGKLDLAAVNINSGNVSLLFGTGTGSFNPAININTGVRPYYVNAGDFNNDGMLDLAVNHEDALGGSNNILILRGDGTGGFTPLNSIQPEPAYTRVADFNMDGKLDILSVKNPSLGLYFGNGQGGFSAPVVINGGPATSFTIHDFNHDNIPDVAAGTGSSAVVILGNGNGTFSAPISYPLAAQFGSFPSSGDFNGDGHVHIVATNSSTDGRVFILLGNGAGSFTVSGNYSVNGQQPIWAATAGFNGDGRADVVTSNFGDSSHNLSVLLSTCLNPTPRHDFDGDGKADIAVYRSSDGTWYIKQSANNSLRTQPFGTNIDLPLAGDFDGDGRADVAVYRPTSGTWYALLSSNGSLYAQRWGSSSDIPVPADYDGDGRTDAAVYRAMEGAWYILGSSDGSFISQRFGLVSDVPVESIPFLCLLYS